MVTSAFTVTPGNNGITVKWNNATGAVNTAVYTPQGQLIRCFHSRPTEKTGCITWHGIDNYGNPVGSGCYIVRIHTAETESSQRFILSR